MKRFLPDTIFARLFLLVLMAIMISHMMTFVLLLAFFGERQHRPDARRPPPTVEAGAPGSGPRSGLDVQAPRGRPFGPGERSGLLSGPAYGPAGCAFVSGCIPVLAITSGRPAPPRFPWNGTGVPAAGPGMPKGRLPPGFAFGC